MGHTCHLRLREAQLEMCNPEPIWELSTKRMLSKTCQNNLNLDILVTAKDLGFSVHTEYLEREWSFAKTSENRTKIVDLLYNSNWKGSLKSLRRMRVWYLGQLIDTQGMSLFTWHQLRKLLNLSATGKKASWFQRIEDIVLSSSMKREVKENFSRTSFNLLTTEVKLKKISAKRSRKEWTLSDNNKENEYIIGKIGGKKKARSEIVPWLRVNKENLNANSKEEIKM